jgi:hypothetical protein
MLLLHCSLLIADRFNICQILLTAGGQFIGDEIRRGNIWCGDFVIYQDGNAVRINSRKVDAIDVLNDFKADGRNSKTRYRFAIVEVRDRDFANGAPNSPSPL